MSGLKVETHFAKAGGEKAGVVEFIQSSGADLAVLATRGRTGLEAKPVATTAERVLREASCSVLALKKEEFKHDVVGEANTFTVVGSTVISADQADANGKVSFSEVTFVEKESGQS